MKKLNWGIIFERCREKHDGRYEYRLEDQGEYENAHMKMWIRCDVHGFFEQVVNTHLHAGKGCRECGNITNWGNRRQTWDDIIIECMEIHNGYYTYIIGEQEEYKLNTTLMVVHCPKHGAFDIRVTDHKNNARGCQTCAKEIGRIRRQIGWESVIESCKLKHNNLYNYYIDEQLPYEGIHTPFTAHCNIHGRFTLSADSHRRGTGCKSCAINYVSSVTRFDWDITIEQCKERHNDRYWYDKDEQEEYKNTNTPMVIHCRIHDIFTTSAKSHKRGSGCPTCSNSHNVIKIYDYLTSQNISFIQEYGFDDCRGDTRLLPFDFYLPDLNILIEYDGRQHYEYIPNWFHKKGYWQFERQQRYDEIKNQYCRDNNIDLLRIRYDDNVLDVLGTYLAKFL